MKLAVVTATTNVVRALSCIKTWCVPTEDTQLIVVVNSPSTPKVEAVRAKSELPRGIYLYTDQYLGTVAAFKKGVDFALAHTNVDIIANLHDDLEIHQSGWIEQVLRHFTEQPACGLAGFGGAIGLGDDQIYQKPYEPVQLARKGFRSNLVDAEVHGLRSALREEVVCLDGFSQIGRRRFWEGWSLAGVQQSPPWTTIDDLGVVHHAYDGMLGCLARRYGWTVWYLPVRCRHLGGATAVADEGYQQWAKEKVTGGDHGLWEHAHKIWYDTFRDILPIRL